MIALVSVVCLYPVHRTQVIGKIAPDDLDDIERIVRHELRFWILPKLEWDNVYHLDYVVRSVREYEAQRILWAEAKPDGSVEVFAGVSKSVILSEGHVFDLRKQPKWEVTGYAYWASSNVAPHDIHVPPSP